MRKVTLLVVAILVITILIGLYFAFKHIQIVGNYIFVSDPNAKGSWKVNDPKSEWWIELNKETKKKVIVYLSPYTEYSSNSLQKDDVSLIYANWKKWSNVHLLSISVEWSSWNQLISDEKQNRMTAFIVQHISMKQLFENRVTSSIVQNALDNKISPLELKAK